MMKRHEVSCQTVSSQSETIRTIGKVLTESRRMTAIVDHGDAILFCSRRRRWMCVKLKDLESRESRVIEPGYGWLRCEGR